MELKILIEKFRIRVTCAFRLFQDLYETANFIYKGLVAM